MPGLKTRKKTSKSAKKVIKSKPKKTLKLKSGKAKTKKIVKAKKPKFIQPAPHPDETSVRLGPHHVDRHPIAAAFHLHPAPTMHPVGPMAMKHPRTTYRGH